VGDTIEMDVEKIDIDLKMQEDEEMKQVIEGFNKQTEEKLDKLIGKSGSPIDTRSSSIRTGESGFGNFICDVIRHWHECDFVMVNSGIIRSDTLYPEGNISMRNLIEIVPFNDAVVVIKVSGNDLKQALENGFSKFPKHDGRFPQIGGFKVQWDPRREPGDRVTSMTKLDGQPIQLDEIYTLGTKQFMTEKHDGYDVLSDKEFVVDVENGPPLSILMRNYFLMLKVLSKMNKLISTPAERGVQNFLSKIKKKKKFDLIYPEVDNRLINVEAQK
jgi:2',3'-cyclic-nucleotide 2'-phosphodiesterase (5'-nucleotidase family)